MKLTPSPFAPSKLPDMPEISGVKLAVCETGMKYKNRPDVLLTLCEKGTVVACVATKSTTASSAVRLCEAHAKDGRGRLLLVNAGNSNAFTGAAGAKATTEVMQQMSAAADADYTESFMCSTGVIGQLLNSTKLLEHKDALLSSLGKASWHEAAQAIMTTDTFAKCASVTANVQGKTVTINGIAKGSGMIAPNMATMLAFFYTDAAIEPALLQDMFRRCTDKSFNCITVDSDTSTSDTGLIFATGKAGNKMLATREDAAAFEAALLEIMQDLAKQIVRDGEGAQTFVTIEISGAASDADAHQIGMSIANSPLVKTAISGGDANWGRIVMAVGKSGVDTNPDELTIRFGEQIAAKNGQLNPDYDEAKATEHVKGSEVSIGVSVGSGSGSGTATIWTCDFTHGYVDINGAYRT